MSHDVKAPGPNLAEVRGHIAAAQRQRAVGPGLASFGAAGGFWLLTLAGAALAPWWAGIPLALLNGLAISVLFVVGHDAGHGSLMPRRWMNRLIGRLGLLPALHPFAAWVHNHNGLHHGFTNIREKDPGFPPLSPDEYRALPAWRRGLYRVGRTWYGLGLLYFVDMWVKWEMFPAAHRAPRNRPAYRRDRLLVAAVAAGWVGGLVAVALWQGRNPLGLVAIGFVLPQAMWNYLAAFCIFQQHMHPEVPWYSGEDPPPSYFQAQIRATPHLVFPFPVPFVMRHIMEHTAHHADPSIPLYHLAGAQAALDHAYPGDILCRRWKLKQFLRMLRTCRLYDYAAHRWVDYDGTPLTVPLLPPTVAPRARAA